MYPHFPRSQKGNSISGVAGPPAAFRDLQPITAEAANAEIATARAPRLARDFNSITAIVGTQEKSDLWITVSIHRGGLAVEHETGISP